MRAALPDDSPQLAALMGELGYPTTREFIQEKLAQLSSTPGTEIFVADYDGKVIGLLSFSILPLLHLDGGLGRITALVVASQFKGRGIGKRLVAEAEAFAWNNRCARIEITSGEHRPTPMPSMKQSDTSKTAEGLLRQNRFARASEWSALPGRQREIPAKTSSSKPGNRIALPADTFD
jgi:GNAT superfamily N-acetyltransferase